MDDLAAVLERQDTRIYLDTSLLMWLIRLGRQARAEFLTWAASRPAGTVRVPVWAAHELHTHTVRNSLSKTIASVANDVERKYSEFVRFAAERADETVCLSRGFRGRLAYLGEVQASLSKLKRLAEVMKDETALPAAAEEVIAFCNDHLMTTDIRPIVRSIAEDGEMRYSHLMPPGFHDKKEEDRFGDLIIWQEIAADMPSAPADPKPTAVLVSRDAKTDWVSTAPRILDERNAVTKPNRERGFDVVLPHPLLVHEFGKMTQGCDIRVVQPGVLATAVAATGTAAASATRTWLSASFRPEHVENVVDLVRRLAPAKPEGAPPDVGTSAPSTSDPTDQATPVDGGAAGTTPRLSELLPSGVGQAASTAASLPLADQDAAVAAWLVDLAEERLTAAEYGGRLATYYSAPESMADLAGILDVSKGSLDPAVFGRVLLAVGVHAFFDRGRELRRPPLTGIVGPLLAYADDPEGSRAFGELATLLDEAGAELLFVPGQKKKPPFQLDLAEAPDKESRLLRAAKINGQNVLVELEDAGSRRLLTSLMGGTTCTGAQLRQVLAREYAIPADVLAGGADKQTIRWNEGAGLALLDPEAPGGVSPLNDGEEI